MTSTGAPIGSADVRAAVDLELDRLREACLAADGGCAVMRCVWLCALHGLQMPQWLRDPFIRNYNRVSDAHVATWDEAFGRPWPRRTRLAMVRRRRSEQLRAHEAVWALLRTDPRRPVNRDLFEEAGEPIGYSGAQAERLYYAAVSDGMTNLAAWKAAMSLERSANPG